MLEIIGLRLGSIGLFCLVFLFLPVARGSVLLRLIDIPFEHATRYHVWLGHLTMVLFTLHGLFYVIAWSWEGKLTREVSMLTDILPPARFILVFYINLIARKIRFTLLYYNARQSISTNVSYTRCQSLWSINIRLLLGFRRKLQFLIIQMTLGLFTHSFLNGKTSVLRISRELLALLLVYWCGWHRFTPLERTILSCSSTPISCMSSSSCS